MAVDIHRLAAVGGESPSRSARLRAALTAPELCFLMEAHDGLSAKIVEEAGFEAIWASGLSVSAALGVRDSNEASWTQVLEVLEFMADATTVPILTDGDTGYGNFNNVRRLVKKLCQRGIAGVCIEDKLFPKTNSFIGEGQPLADIGEFCGKIKAGKDSQTDPDFCLVARIEALISGRGLDEALRRAEAYRAAGADAILVHSKQPDAGEILSFQAEWGGRCPVVIVPTTYSGTPTEKFREAGISAVIWANHTLRASIEAMREVTRAIHERQSVAEVEGRIAAVRDIFDLVGNAELGEAEKRYLPSGDRGMSAIVLAASRGAALGPLTVDKPKCMIDIRGKPLLRRLVSTLTDRGVHDVSVVRGYRKDAVAIPSVRTFDNDAFAETGEAASLACAADRLDGDCLIAYGDILFRRYVLDRLLETEGDVVVAADALWRERTEQAPDRDRDLVVCSKPFRPDFLDEEPAELVRITEGAERDGVHGEWVGLVKLSPDGAAAVRAMLDAMRADGTLPKASLPDLFNRLVEAGTPPKVVYVTGHWLDVDDAFDLAKARDFL